MPELHGEAIFAWEFPFPLRPGDAFQLLIWRAGDREHHPASEYLPELELIVNLDDVPQVRQGGEGEYEWSVVVVDTRTHEPVSPEADAGSFVYVGPQPPPGEAPPLPAPILIEPPPGAELGDAALFSWEWPHEPLGEEFLFDLRIWAIPEGELPLDARRSATRPTQRNEVEIELPGVPTIVDHGPGDYFWTVVVVLRPCPGCPLEIVSEWEEERLFHYVRPHGP
jgi:hypothetical protein